MKFRSIFELDAVNIRAEPEFLRFLHGTLTCSVVGAELSEAQQQPPHAAEAMGAEDNVNFLSHA